MKKPLCMMSILTTLMVSSQNAVGAVPTATIAPTTSIVCKSVSSYDQPNFIMNSGDRLLTKAEFNYYWGISDEDRKYLSEFQIMLSKFKISILALPIPYQAALYIDSRNNPAPGRYDPLQALENYRTQIKNLNDHGFTALDLQEIAKKMPQGTDFFARRDHHWTSEAMEKVADAVKITVDKLNLNIDRNAITSLTRKVVDYGGSLADELSKACGYTFPISEKRTFYDLSIKSNESLLGDTNNDVLLLGDSYSTSYFGFDKILSDRLKTPIINAGINGGGCCAAINGFFAELHPEDAKPKLIIWTALMVLTNANEMRELKPAVYQAYQQNKSLKEVTDPQIVSSSSNFNQKLDKSSRYYIKLKLSGPKVEELHLKLDYGGKSENIALYRKNEKQQSIYSTTFFYELKPGIDNLATINYVLKEKTDAVIGIYKYN